LYALEPNDIHMIKILVNWTTLLFW
jgi:hypothetical protein